MHNAEWTGSAGADQWDVGVGHSDVFDVYVLVSIRRGGRMLEDDDFDEG